MSRVRLQLSNITFQNEQLQRIGKNIYRAGQSQTGLRDGFFRSGRCALRGREIYGKRRRLPAVAGTFAGQRTDLEQSRRRFAGCRRSRAGAATAP